jgi:hypothetical protein
MARNRDGIYRTKTVQENFQQQKISQWLEDFDKKSDFSQFIST